MQPFGRTSLKECIRLRDRSLELGDEVRRDRKDPNIWLVSSHTYPGVWYRVNAEEATCGCEGFKHHKNCRHLCRVAWERHLARRAKVIERAKNPDNDAAATETA